MIDVHGLPAWCGLRPAPLAAARVAVAGIPYDGSATYRRSASHAPARMRRLSAVMPPIDERGRCFGDLTLHDLGDLELGDSVAAGWQAAAQRMAELPPGAFLTVFGGDHCSAIPVLAAQARRHPDLAVLWVDALDPAFAPGTEIPCAGGLSTRQALDLVAAVARASRPVGLDVCEVAPVGADEITVLAALKLVFETWALL